MIKKLRNLISQPILDFEQKDFENGDSCVCISNRFLLIEE